MFGGYEPVSGPTTPHHHTGSFGRLTTCTKRPRRLATSLTDDPLSAAAFLVDHLRSARALDGVGYIFQRTERCIARAVVMVISVCGIIKGLAPLGPSLSPLSPTDGGPDVFGILHMGNAPSRASVGIGPAYLETKAARVRDVQLEKFVLRARPRLKPRFGLPAALIVLLAAVAIVLAAMLGLL